MLRILISLLESGGFTAQELALYRRRNLAGNTVFFLEMMEDVRDSLLSRLERDYSIKSSLSENTDSLLFGVLDPEKLCHEVSLWNNAIRAMLFGCTSKVTPFEDLLFDEKAAEDMEHALRMARNEFLAKDGCVGTYLQDSSGEWGWRTILTDFDLQQILEHPERYAIVEVQVNG